MSLTPREIAEVVAELAPLQGSRVDGVRAHADRAFTLDLYGRAGAATLLVSVEPERARLHAVERRPPRPEAPPALQGLLRRELEGARLARLAARPEERAVVLEFERPAGRVALRAELDHRGGQLALVAEDGTARVVAGRSASRPPEAGAAPAARDRGAPDRPAPAPGDAGPYPRSAALEARYRALEEERALAEARRRLREPVRAGVARDGRTLAKLAEEAARVPAAEADRRRGDLLKQHLHTVPRGARAVLVTEWTEEGPREVAVPLDPALSPRGNLERYYRRYRRIVESAARVAAREAEVRARRAALEALLAAVERAGLEELPRLEREARRLGAGPRPPQRPRARRDEPLPPYRLFRALSGLALLVGRGAEANDALTVRVARGNDLWLHARGQAGAHVVVRLDKAGAPDGEALLDAAHLAAHFSDARGEPQVEVVATRAKYVRKVRGAAPGAVTYSQERTILLRVEPQRIERLLASEEQP